MSIVYTFTKRFIFVLLIILALIAAFEFFISRESVSDNLETPKLSETQDTFKIVTFNVGLLDLRYFGVTVFKPADFVEERFVKLAPALKALDADIVALQEVYETDHITKLLADVQDVYPYSFYKESAVFRLNNGLVLLSKFPLRKTGLYPIEAGPIDETVFGSKAAMSVVVKLDEERELSLINIHPTSGGTLDVQDSAAIMEDRRLQLEQAHQLDVQNNIKYSMILGDYNTSPKIASANYEYLKQYGYVDAYARYCGEHNCSLSMTWDPDNPLNIGSTHADSLTQRIDHIFLSSNLTKASEVRKAEVIFSDPVVEIEGKGVVPISDHYGVAIELYLPAKK
ncbi:endonuclease/exonuclease/phosphatase family protein [Kordiimonas laminariae]|uniref:endonuclease/exonuclease/phosphatase family protein n=1 Tax=Kordiimonas laminariae TaxID=2917717 RepID=UPI001FF5BF4D|nr:endonuclease/exonuclease/phosphatase family protein [Kordiimonas laminariae]MCK0067930.1 endonuclease/exonuclease/phosphatase family protein [Kordiimonas laminariae]